VRWAPIRHAIVRADAKIYLSFEETCSTSSAPAGYCYAGQSVHLPYTRLAVGLELRP
jgi:hypothetical protein